MTLFWESIFTWLLYQTVLSVVGVSWVLLAIPVLLVMFEGFNIGIEFLGANEKPVTYTLK